MVTQMADKSAAGILNAGAKTYEERNKVYGNSFDMVAALMVVLFPDGVVLHTAEEFRIWHNFELVVVKLARFANSGLVHQDSIHDLMVYAAIVESFINSETKPIGGIK